MALRVGGWNLRKLGLEQHKDVARIAGMIQRHFDLVALMEVMYSPDDAEYRALEEALGHEWKLVRTATPRPNLPSPHSEYYVVALRRARVSGCSPNGEASLTYVPDGEGSDGSDERGLFLREPAFGCFRTLGPHASNDFALGVYHAEWGSGAADAIAAEVTHVDLAFAAMQARFPQERQRFLVGDFNLDAAALAPLTSARDRTRGEGSTLNTQGRISGHLYDHLLAHDTAAERALCEDAQVLDLRGEAFDLSAFRAQVSDHLPLVAHVHVAADDD
ncbi:MAG TPA: endonuclease/exonuclease/phosphatase family protein [Polyangiales bacterium]